MEGQPRDLSDDLGAVPARPEALRAGPDHGIRRWLPKCRRVLGCLRPFQYSAYFGVDDNGIERVGRQLPASVSVKVAATFQHRSGYLIRRCEDGALDLRRHEQR
jgi:hypothetical protein